MRKYPMGVRWMAKHLPRMESGDQSDLQICSELLDAIIFFLSVMATWNISFNLYFSLEHPLSMQQFLFHILWRWKYSIFHNMSDEFWYFVSREYQGEASSVVGAINEIFHETLIFNSRHSKIFHVTSQKLRDVFDYFQDFCLTKICFYSAVSSIYSWQSFKTE